MPQELHKLTLEVIRKCPNKCLHCSTNSSPSAKDFISLQRAKLLIEQGKKLGLKKLIISGGEPLIYPDLLSLVEFAHSHSIFVVIYTSGSIFSESKEPTFVPSSSIKQLITAGASRFNLSIHSHIAEIHDKFMDTPGSWERAIDFLTKLIELHPEVHIHTVISKFNYQSIFDLLSFINKYDVDVLRLLQLVPQGRAKINISQLEVTDTDWIVIRNQIEQICAHQDFKTKVRLGAHLTPMIDQLKYACSLDSAKLVIEPDESVSVCPAFKGLKKQLNAPTSKEQSIQSINHSDWRNYISNLKKDGQCIAQRIYSQEYINNR